MMLQQKRSSAAAAAPRRMRRLLVLGGTAEAAALVAQAAALPGFHVITSLAGRTRAPLLPEGEVRIGGFGGPEGLARYLDEARIDLVIDATHPFAAAISRHAAEASAKAGVQRLMLRRPAWEKEDGDNWIEVADVAEAARWLPETSKRIFLAIGRQELASFAAHESRWFLLRVVDRPEGELPLPNCALLVGRGPFTLEDERRILAAHHIDTVVSKNSGGAATYAKLAAARELGIPVVMIRRPALPEGERVETVEAALAWLKKRQGRARKIC